MSFGGAVQAMITSLKNNSRQRKSLFDNKDRSIGTTTSDSWKKALERKATPEQLEELRIKNKLENRKDTIKKIIALILTIIIMGLFVFWFYHS